MSSLIYPFSQGWTLKLFKGISIVSAILHFLSWVEDMGKSSIYCSLFFCIWNSWAHLELRLIQPNSQTLPFSSEAGRISRLDEIHLHEDLEHSGHVAGVCPAATLSLSGDSAHSGSVYPTEMEVKPHWLKYSEQACSFPDRPHYLRSRPAWKLQGQAPQAVPDPELGFHGSLGWEMLQGK